MMLSTHMANRNETSLHLEVQFTPRGLILSVMEWLSSQESEVILNSMQRVEVEFSKVEIWSPKHECQEHNILFCCFFRPLYVLTASKCFASRLLFKCL